MSNTLIAIAAWLVGIIGIFLQAYGLGYLTTMEADATAWTPPLRLALGTGALFFSYVWTASVLKALANEE